jgi:hypothetical protein
LPGSSTPTSCIAAEMEREAKVEWVVEPAGR